MKTKIQSIKFQGKNFTLLVLYLNNDVILNLKKLLYKKINQSPLFFKNAPIVVNVQSLSSKVNWIEIKKIIISFGLYIIGFSDCCDQRLKQKIIDSGIPQISEKNYVFNKLNINKLIKTKNFFAVKKNINCSKIVKTPIRSGQKLYVSNSDLIVINNVSPGAELIAEGSIHIYGTLRGKVLAGAQGNRYSHIFCTAFFAELVSIAGLYWLIDEVPSNLIGKSVHFFLENGSLNVNKLN